MTSSRSDGQPRPDATEAGPWRPQTDLPVSPGRFVWLVWAGMTILCLGYLLTFASNVPFADDVLLVPRAVGEEPVTLGWLWEQYNQQRMPLPKLVFAWLPGVTGGFFGVKCLNVLLMAGLAALLIDTVRRVRGRPDYADAAFPLLALNLGQGEVFTIGMALNLVGSTVLTGTAVRWVLLSDRSPSFRSLVALGACVIALPLTSAAGAVSAGVLVPWLCWLAVRQTGKPGMTAVLHTAVALLVLSAVLGIELSYTTRLSLPGAGGPLPRANFWLTVGQVLSLGSGTTDPRLWPGLAVSVTALMLVAGLLVVRRAVARPEEAFRAAGVVSCLGGVLLVAGCIAWGRGGDAPMSSRYVPLMVLGPAIALLATVAAGDPRWARGLTWGWLGLQLMLFRSSADAGLTLGAHMRSVAAALRADIKSGMPLRLVAERNAARAFDNHLDRFAVALRHLRSAGWQPFGSLPPETPLTETEIDLPSGFAADLGGVCGGTAAAGTGPEITVSLPKRLALVGVRVTYRLDTAGEYNWIYVKPCEASPAAAVPVTNAEGLHSEAVWLPATTDRLRLKLYHPTLNVRVIRLTVLSAAGPDGRPRCGPPTPN